MSAQPSVQRQDRLTGKLVQEIARQLTVRHPDPPITPAEEEYIAVEVRRHIFKGNPLASSDIAQIISNVIGRRAPAQQQLQPRPASVSSLPLETQTNDGVSVRSRRSRGSVTPSLVRSTTSRHESICESNASVARSAASVSTRLSVVRDRDRRVLEALTQMCSATPTRESRPVVPRPIVPPVAPPLAPPPELAEAEIQARAAAAARARLAEQQLEIRRALDAQISLKKAKAIAEAEEERRERDARVAAAAQSLSADAAKVVEQRKQREEERKQNASVVAESVARKRSTRVKEIELERAMAAEEVVDHETKIRAERDQRRRAVEHLRTELLTEAEKKVRAKKQAEVEQLEYEIKLLEQMNAKVEQERLNQEKMRLDRIRAAKETQEACRHMVEANKQREHAEKSSADKVTIDGDKSFIEKERQEAARRRQQNRDTQVYLQQQILERQLRHVLQKSDDDPYANKERIEEMEAKHREAEELEIKREAQRQWRHFLDMQQKAKQAVKSVSDVAVSITRPSSNTPWF